MWPAMTTNSTLVREYMSPTLVAVDAGASLDHVVHTLVQHNVSSVLVEDAGAPAGIISMTDLVRVSKLMPEQDRKPLRMVPPDLRARDVARPEIVSVAADATVGEAAKKMLDGRIHRVFVKDGKKVVGVFSTRDAMRVVLARKIEVPLEDVMSSPVDTVSIGATIEDVLGKLEDSNQRGIVVLDGRVPVGLFTQLEAIKARALPEKLRSNPVEELMSYEHAALDRTTPLYRAAGQAIATNVRRILVTESRALVGIVTGYDVARVLIDPSR